MFMVFHCSRCVGGAGTVFFPISVVSRGARGPWWSRRIVVVPDAVFFSNRMVLILIRSCSD